MTVRWFSEKAFEPTITFEELQRRIAEDKPDSFSLIDVREPNELREGVIPSATNIPLSQFADAFAANHEDFEDKLGFEKPSPSDEIIVYCKAGARSAAAICLSTDEKNERDRSQQIDRQLEEDNKKLKRECKILLLGSGESGKSTIVKQMKIIHQNGYTKEELHTWRPTVYKNLIQSIKTLVTAANKLGIQFHEPRNEVYSQHVMLFTVADITSPLTPEFVEAIVSIWNDPAIANVLDHNGSEFYLMDSATYFFCEVRRIGKSDYIPTVQDVLRARQKTTGIMETRFTMGQLNIHMFDVGGQRSERKKWIHCFESVTSIIFCVALSEYDQELLEASGQNRMLESLVLFESVINSRWFLRSSIIFFLNKVDVFKVKIARVPLEKYFTDYAGGPDVNKAAKYILWRFSQVNRAKLNIYPHLTQATDTSNIRLVFAAIKETILQNALKDSGIL
ncbi:unnamed protein product [Umbelopsis vinacea]